MKERKDRVEDAMHATRAAVKEGILPGGGVALLHAVKALAKLKPENEDQRVGIDIVRRALQAPARQIVVNAGAGGAVVVGKLLEKASTIKGTTPSSAQVNMVTGDNRPDQGGRSRAAGRRFDAGLLITTEAMVAELPKKKERDAGDAAGWRHGLLIPAARSTAVLQMAAKHKISPGLEPGVNR